MDYMLEYSPLLFAGVFILGLLIGSFLNVVILRYPAQLEYDWRCQCRELLGVENEETKQPAGLVFERSRCPSCGHTIGARENIPLLSFLFLRGECSQCKSQISFRYPLVEFATAILFLATIWSLGPNLAGLTALLLTAFLIAMTGIDIDHQLLPDTLTLPLMWTGIGLSIWSVHIDLQSSVIGAITGYLSLWGVFHTFRLLTGKEGMGYGDFKLLAALGAWLGWQMLPLIIIISSLAGAIIGLVLMGTGHVKRESPIPFGPFIATAGWIALIWGDRIIGLYTGSPHFG